MNNLRLATVIAATAIAAHGIVLTTARPALARTWMPMMTAAPALQRLGAVVSW